MFDTVVFVQDMDVSICVWSANLVMHGPDAQFRLLARWDQSDQGDQTTESGPTFKEKEFGHGSHALAAFASTGLSSCRIAERTM